MVLTKMLKKIYKIKLAVPGKLLCFRYVMTWSVAATEPARLWRSVDEWIKPRVERPELQGNGNKRKKMQMFSAKNVFIQKK